MLALYARQLASLQPKEAGSWLLRQAATPLAASPLAEVQRAVLYDLARALKDPEPLIAELKNGDKSAQAALQELHGALRRHQKRGESGVLITPLKQAVEELLDESSRWEKSLAIFDGWETERDRELRAKGLELQAWGVPNVSLVSSKGEVAAAKLYRPGGTATDLGEKLHGLLAPLAAEGSLPGIGKRQLESALKSLRDSLDYQADPRDFNALTAKERLSAQLELSDGFDYPRIRQALVENARAILKEPLRTGQPLAGLGPTPESERMSPVLLRVLEDLKSRAGSSRERSEAAAELIEALHAALALPLRTAGGWFYVPVRHKQLLLILPELHSRQIAPKIINGLLRSYPLGEVLFRLRAPQAWSRGHWGQNIRVGIIDHGVDFNHPEFAGAGIGPGDEFTDDALDHRFGAHATAMAGIIHAIAPGAELHSYHALSNAELQGVQLNPIESVEALVSAMKRAAEDGMDIINISAGMPMGHAGDLLARTAEELGILVIAAAGNWGMEAEGGQIASPAVSPSVISVGGMDYYGRVRGNSSMGYIFDRRGSVVREGPDFWGYGHVKAALQYPSHLYHEEPAPYGYVSGSSPAAAQYTGLAALMYGAAGRAALTARAAALPRLVRLALEAGIANDFQAPLAPEAISAFLEAISQ